MICLITFSRGFTGKKPNPYVSLYFGQKAQNNQQMVLVSGTIVSGIAAKQLQQVQYVLVLLLQPWLLTLKQATVMAKHNLWHLTLTYNSNLVLVDPDTKNQGHRSNGSNRKALTNTNKHLHTQRRTLPSASTLYLTKATRSLIIPSGYQIKQQVKFLVYLTYLFRHMYSDTMYGIHFCFSVRVKLRLTHRCSSQNLILEIVLWELWSKSPILSNHDMERVYMYFGFAQSICNQILSYT